MNCQQVVIFLVLLWAPLSFAVSGWTYRTTDSTCDATVADPCGPAEWGVVAEACANTHSNYQSPINFDYLDVESSSVETPQFHVEGEGCSAWVQFTNQYVFEVSFEEAGCHNLTVVYEGETLHLAQIHFHSPSEHTIGGGKYDAEAHLVHVNDDGTNIVVLGIFLSVHSNNNVPQTNNSFLDSFWKAGRYQVDSISDEHHVTGAHPLNPYTDFTPARPGLFVYEGSLTVPACSPVHWFVFDEPVLISSNDLHFLRGSVLAHSGNLLSELGNNNREPQLLNGRVVHYATGFSETVSISESSTSTLDRATRAALALGALGFAFSVIVMAVVIYLIYTACMRASDKLIGMVAVGSHVVETRAMGDWNDIF